MVMDEINKRRFLLIAKTQEYQSNLAEAVLAIQEAIEKCKNPAVNFSFGKDSLVCMDIARQIKPDILIINIDRGFGGDVPDAMDTYKSYFSKNNINFKRVKTPQSIFEIYTEAGSLHKINKERVKRNLILGIKKAIMEYRIDCSIIGLRAQESIGRNKLKSRGNFYYTKSDGVFHCCPVLNWSSDQIWAYIVSNDLPYLKWYDLEAEFDGYGNSRYSNWAGLYMYETGRIVRLKKTYPELYNIFASEFPEVREFG
jgi:3'-phosphoadenosine 5'-phosphosulfate sulfotransferase (PAPS reductase)/FAD synthetase